MAAFATAASGIYFFMFSLSGSLPLSTGAAIAAVDAALMQMMNNFASRGSRRMGEGLDSTCVHVSRAHDSRRSTATRRPTLSGDLGSGRTDVSQKI